MTLLKIVKDVYENVEAKASAIIVALDISAAFDTISHSKLVNILQQDFGIDGAALLWITSYLRNRSQFVKISSQSSTTTQLDSCVPQGSVLGPLLFSSYISPVGEVIRSCGLDHHQYADYSQLYYAVSTRYSVVDIKVIEAGTLAVQEWFLDNDLLLNPAKSEVVAVGTPAQLRFTTKDFKINIAGSSLHPVDKIKSLGDYIDSYLSMNVSSAEPLL